MELEGTSCCGMSELYNFGSDSDKVFRAMFCGETRKSSHSWSDLSYQQPKTVKMDNKNLKQEIKYYIEEAKEEEQAILIATTVGNQQKAARALKACGFVVSQTKTRRSGYSRGDNVITLWTFEVNPH